MQNTRRLFKRRIAVVFLATLLGLIALMATLIVRSLNELRAQQNVPPTVIVHTPIAGQSAPAGSHLLAHVTAIGQKPIARIELWLDGEPLETQMPDQASGEWTTFHATADLLMTEGPHMLSARAVDADGLVGQSLPIPIQGNPPPDKATVVVTAKEGDTLHKIADTRGVDVGTLRGLNPDLGDDGLPADTPIVAPLVPEPGAGGNSSEPRAPSDNSDSAPPPAPPAGVPALQEAEFLPVDTWLPNFLLSNRPKPPSSLQVEVEDCKVRLQWQDNADNETHFEVWMQGLGMPPRVIATLRGTSVTGPAWYEFASPEIGFYSFWLEAVNGLGGQPSEVKWVRISNPSCPTGLATHLEIEAVDMNVVSGYDRVYCYLSLEGAPEKRVPTDLDASVKIINGQGNIANWAAGDKRILVPIPTDEEVTLEGKCLGRQGAAAPINLGTFRASTPRTSWDGSRQTLKGANFTIDYRIMPFGSVDSAGAYTYYDHTTAVPYDLSVEILVPSIIVNNENPNVRRPSLKWKWDGDRDTLSGFTVFMNGNPVRQVPANFAWSAGIDLPSSCGGVYEFTVAANLWDGAMSPPSEPFKHVQARCQLYAKVDFIWIQFAETDDGWDFPSTFIDCEEVQLYYTLYVNSTGHPNTEKQFWGDGHLKPVVCGKWWFEDLAYPWNRNPGSDQIIVPIDPPLNEPNLNWGGITLGAVIWDWDMSSSDDLVAAFSKTVTMSLDDWDGFEQIYEDWYPGGESYGYVRYKVTGYRVPESGESRP